MIKLTHVFNAPKDKMLLLATLLISLAAIVQYQSDKVELTILSAFLVGHMFTRWIESGRMYVALNEDILNADIDKERNTILPES